ncbi:MAG: TetM/TetW/TetO/TetS family tetracycline resistance ribosomal protection protein [Nonomuraea sp.]|nr:TetM/TetW/TetO/TetS family tetracycline resistance ribosomal protection protein [Nonomuraea sp.]
MLNIGILAHVDAGKTSLTERLLFETGVTGRLGSVDDGSTQTDTGDIERRRGITIRSAVASFTLGDLRVNLVDTPGHADFVAEVERALGVLDGAVLVVSAVEGVQPHTRVLMKTLRRLGLPTLIFVNKIDRAGAREGGVLAEIRRWLTPRAVALNTVRDIGAPVAATRPFALAASGRAQPPGPPGASALLVATGVEEAAEVLADGDDGLLELLVEGVRPAPERVRAALAAQCAAGAAHPVLFGSAITGQGVAELLEAIRLLPAVTQPPPGAGRAEATVFAVERGRSGEKVAYLRVRGGGLRVRERVTFLRRQAGGGVHVYEGRLSGLVVVGSGAATAVAGDIVKVWGVPEIRVGDRLGEPGPVGEAHFAAPSLETVVRPMVPGQEGRLHAALVALAEQDPLIGTRTLAGGDTAVLLYGEVQKEVIGETLARDFGVEAAFEPSRPVYFERPSGTGEAAAGMSGGPDGFMATVGLRVEPAAPGSGVVYRLEVDLGSLPLAFHRAIEESVRQTLREGPRGRPVTDVTVTLVATGYDSPVTVAGDFRAQARAVLTRALDAAGTRVYEPCHRFELEVPVDTFSAVTARLAGLGAVLADTVRRAETWVIEGEIPAAAVHEFERRLAGLSHGEGVWWSQPSGDRPKRA